MPPEQNQSSLAPTLGKFFWVAAWLIGLVGLTVLFYRHDQQQSHPNAHLSINTTEQSTTLQQNRQGHYLTPCFINDYQTSCLLDTGATTVAISTTLAQIIGLKNGPPMVISTANGRVQAYATWLKSVRFGSIELYDVRAVITPGLEGQEILLGMSALKHLKIVQEDQRLTLSQ